MASSLYSNAQHVDFDSVLAMDDPGMVSMFEALMASGHFSHQHVDFDSVLEMNDPGMVAMFEALLFAKIEMASSLFSNAQHVDFDSVLEMN
ncbi:lysM domain receptor-like kinase 3 [Dorcoceras hygrometricum]|uniref:LysM domain receptor-like kinase 3 n=1 Tax=Dorcoceras hygrometricum TaxID=472368 RepID=A0A2Z7AVV6_9LAMI|nr:lysM domain receptor-like kinase 3 [Dorcoceras hygrometricum]